MERASAADWSVIVKYICVRPSTRRATPPNTASSSALLSRCLADCCVSFRARFDSRGPYFSAARTQQQAEKPAATMCTHGASMSGPWEWLGPLAPLFAHLHPGAQKPAESAPACDQAPADHGRLARGVSDAIPWYRPFYWSPTTDCEAQEALQNVLPLIGCANFTCELTLTRTRHTRRPLGTTATRPPCLRAPIRATHWAPSNTQVPRHDQAHASALRARPGALLRAVHHRARRRRGLRGLRTPPGGGDSAGARGLFYPPFSAAPLH